MAADDDADREYRLSRRAEVEANEEDLRRAEIARLEAELGLTAANAETPQPAQPAQPTEASAASQPDKKSNKGIADLVAGTEGDSPSVLPDVAAGIGRGAFAFAADVLDNAGNLADETITKYIGEPLGKFFGADIQAGREGSERIANKAVEDRLGKPETGWGQFAQDATGEMIALVPVLRGIRSAGYLNGAKAIFAADFAVTAAGSGPNDQTLVGQGLDLAGVEDNWFTDIVKNDPDDSTAERMLRQGLEGAFIGKAFDKALDGFKSAYNWVRGGRVRRGIVQAAGEQLDEGLEQAAGNVAQARSELQVLRAARESLDEFAAQADNAAEVAAFKGNVSPDAKPRIRVGASLDATPRPADSVSAAKLRETLDAKIVQLEEAVSKSEQELAAVAQESPAHGKVIENIRQELNQTPGGNPKDLDAALGKAADTNLAKQPTVKQRQKLTKIGNHLELDDDTVSMLGRAIVDGDFDGAADALANSFDSSNMAKFDEVDDVKDIISGFGHYLSENSKSERVLYRSQNATMASADDTLARLAAENGASPETIAGRLRQQIPDLNLDVTLKTYQLFEVSLAKRLQTLGKQIAGGNDSEILLEELDRLTRTLANVRDREAGLSTSIGRAMAAQKRKVSSVGIDEVLDNARMANAAARKAAINAAGGKENLKKLAEQLAREPDALKAGRLAADSVNRRTNTIGDILYSYEASNMLSSFPTHTVNVLGPGFRVLAWDPVAGVSGGAIRALGGDTTMLRRELHFAKAKWRALTMGLSLDARVRAASPIASTWKAMKEGQRVTVVDGHGRFTAAGEGNALRSFELARSVKDRLPVHKPFSGFSKEGAQRLPTLGKTVARRLGDALETQAAGKLKLFGATPNDAGAAMRTIYGPAAKIIDFAGRVQSWPRHVIAGADELISAISYGAKLEADAYAAAGARGLTGQEFADYVDNVVQNAPRWQKISETVDVNDPAAMARLNELAGFDKSAQEYVQEATFTQPPGPATESLLEWQRRMPALRWFTFFARTGANIARAAWNTSLPGSALELGGAAIRRNPEEASLAAAKVAINTAIAFKVYDLIQDGRITGSGPINKAERDIWLQTHEPYSIWFEGAGENGKGAWISYARLDPFATQIQVLAELADTLSYMDDADGMSAIDEFYERAGRLIASKTFFQGISDLLAAASGEKNITDLPIQLAKDFIPQSAMLRNLRRTADPARPMIDEGKGWEFNDAGDLVERRQGFVAKWSTELGSTLQSNMPAQAQDEFAGLLNRILDLKLDLRMYPQRDFFGEVSNYPPAYGPDNFSGIVQSEKGADPVVDELLAQDISFSIKERMGHTMEGVELSPEQMDYKHQMFAHPKGTMSIREHLEALFKKDYYVNAGSNVNGVTAKARRQKLIDKVITKRLEAADRMVLEKFPEVRAAVIAQKRLKAQLETQEGSAAAAAEVDERKSTLFRALQKAIQ